MRTLVAGLCLTLAPAGLVAQRLSGSLGGIGGTVRARSVVGTTAEVGSGAVIGVEGRVGIGPVSVDVSYAQGSLNPEETGAETRDYVEGDAYLSVVTFPGVILRAGPHARAYISETGTQRWLFWTGHLRGEYTLITSPAFIGFAEAWMAWSADVNVSEEFDRARGATVGMIVRFPGSLFYGRLAYGIEQARMGGGARVDDVEALTLVVGFGRR